MQHGLDPSSIWLLLVTVLFGILVIPFAIGLNLLRQSQRHEWYLTAGFLTMLPVVTGPIWLFLWIANAASYQLGEAFVIVLPGIILTGIIAIRFRRCFAGPVAPMMWILLVLGCVRWLNSFMIGAASVFRIDSTVFLVIGATLPTVFAIVAISLSNRIKPLTPG